MGRNNRAEISRRTRRYPPSDLAAYQAKATCAGPGCTNPPRPHKDKTRRASLYCSGRCKTAAWRERRKREKEQTG